MGEPGLCFLMSPGVVFHVHFMTQTLLDCLAKQYPAAKRETLRRMVREGRVTVNGVRPRTVKIEVATTDRVEVADQSRASVTRTAPARLPFRVVHEDADLLVVDKPAGILTSTVPGETRPTLLAIVREYVAANEPRAPLGLIHRLDRDASGLLVFSKSDLAYKSLKTQLFHRTIERVYLALTSGVPNPRSGTIETRLEERADGTVYSIKSSTRGERAVTHYEVVEHKRDRALVRVTLETGRKHQIRVHLAGRKAPIVGDAMYGKPTAEPSRLMLAAVKLSLDHPRDGKRLSFEVRPPKGFAIG